LWKSKEGESKWNAEEEGEAIEEERLLADTPHRAG
jgi:hypothetical protein